MKYFYCTDRELVFNLKQVTACYVENDSHNVVTSNSVVYQISRTDYDKLMRHIAKVADFNYPEL